MKRSDRMYENIVGLVAKLSVGQTVMVPARDFMDACGGLAYYRGGDRGLQGAIDVFLGRVIGSAYGTIRVREQHDPHAVLISRHEADPAADHAGFLYHVDIDRQWMFDRVPGGWQRKPEPQHRKAK